MSSLDRVQVGEYLNLTYTKDDGTVVKRDRIRISSIAAWGDIAIVRLDHSHSVHIGPEDGGDLTGSGPTD